MSVTLIKKAPVNDTWLTSNKGIWRPCGTDAGRTAHVSCPDCGETASLGQHTIADDGTVTPSLGCPYKGCDFHSYVKLEGWEASNERRLW